MGVMSDKEKAKAEKKRDQLKKSFTARTLDAMGDNKLDSKLRESPEEVDKKIAENKEAEKKDALAAKNKKRVAKGKKEKQYKDHSKSKSRWKKAGKVGDKALDITDDTGGAIMDTVGSFMEYADGGKDRTWAMVGDKNYILEGAGENGEDLVGGEIWGDNSAQTIPIIGAVIKTIKLLVDGGKYIKDMVEFARDNKDSADTTREEKWEVFQKTLEMFMSLVDYASSIMSTFTTFVGTLPVVGAILGTIGNCISFGANAYSLVKAGKSISRMKKQRAAAKEAILADKSGDGYDEVVGEGMKKTLLHPKHGVKKQTIGADLGTVTETVDKARPKGGTRTVTRAKRLDEKVLEMKQKIPSKKNSKAGDHRAESKKLVHDLEDYDVAKELTATNKKRAVAGVTDLIMKDAVGIATSLATLDPTGLGSGIGAAINTAISAGSLVKEGASKLRQIGRNHGWKGTDYNKSDDQKEKRRHNLAVIMYKRMRTAKIKHLGNLDGDITTDKVQSSVAAVETLDERITAMGVAGPLFRAAKDQNQAEMLQIMRQGFYRENS